MFVTSTNDRAAWLEAVVASAARRLRGELPYCELVGAGWGKPGMLIGGNADGIGIGNGNADGSGNPVGSGNGNCGSPGTFCPGTFCAASSVAASARVALLVGREPAAVAGAGCCGG